MAKYDDIIDKIIINKKEKDKWNYQSRGELHLSDGQVIKPLGLEPLYWLRPLRIAKHPNENIYAYASSKSNGIKDDMTSCICLYYPENETKGRSFHKIKNYSNHGFDYKPAFSPNGKWLAFISEEEYGKISLEGNLMIAAFYETPKDVVYNLGMKSIRIKEFQWLNDNTILAEYKYKGYSKVCAISFNPEKPSNIISVTQIGNLNLSPKIERGGSLIANGFHFSTDSTVSFDKFSLGRVEHCEYTTKDGIGSFYWFAHPNPRNNHGRTILLCQGGPHHAWEPEIESGTYHIPLLQHLGYSIIMPIVRGMSGITKAFDDQVRGDWGGMCIQDYMAALDTAIEKFNLDKDNVALLGHSFGGFCSYSINVQFPERFCCFVSESGPFNLELLRKYCLEVDETTKNVRNLTMKSELFDGLANENGEAVMKRMIETQSPHLLIQNSTPKPILIIHGKKDIIVPVSQAEEAENAFKSKGISCIYKPYNNDSHVIINNQKDRYKTILEFLDSYMKPALMKI